MIDPQQYLLDCLLLIESHALRHAEVSRIDDDVWSSVRHHLGLRTDPLLSGHPLFWSLGNTPFEREAAWRWRLQEGVPPRTLQAIADAMHKGWALMSPQEGERLQASLGRRLAPRRRGRPAKAGLSV